MPRPTTPNYWSYLKLDRLLELQGGLEDDENRLSNDELHFIVVHQVYELWFKLILRELRRARDELAAPRVAEETIPAVVHHLGRVNEILRLGARQFGVMETLLPQDFLDFRDKLIPASGFQSFQMREMEILLGLEDAAREPIGGVDPLQHIAEMASADSHGRLAWERIERARKETTVRAALHAWLYRTPIQGSSPDDPEDEAVVQAFLGSYLRAWAKEQEHQLERLARSAITSPESARERLEVQSSAARRFLEAEDVEAGDRARTRRLRAAILFIESYRALPLLAWPRLLVDTLVELEERLVLWRTRHARMVERTVGRRTGTGGSAGVDYLDRTAARRIFVELWSVRTLLLPRRALPPLRNPEYYGFAT